MSDLLNRAERTKVFSPYNIYTGQVLKIKHVLPFKRLGKKRKEKGVSLSKAII